MGLRLLSTGGAVAVTLVTLAALPSAPAAADPPATITAPYVDGTLLVGFVPGTPGAEKANARSAAGAKSAAVLSPLATDAELLELAPGRSVDKAIAALSHNPNVRYAEPNYILTHEATSDDPYFTGNSLWGMYGDSSVPANQFGSQAAEAWAAGNTGTSGTYVVVIDEGAQFTHPDLAANIWTNPLETVGDGLDNDSNGYIDDVHGWDFNANDNSTYDGPGDDHGTHVSGTIGAAGGNALGVAGVNWNVTMISAKFLGPSGGSIANAVKAVDYATSLKTINHLNIVATSNSWGGGGFSQAFLDAINRGGDQDILFVAAAGNSGLNNDTTPSYPSNYQCTKKQDLSARGWDCVVAVAAIDKVGALASFSQYGATTVDLGAPGVDVNSTLPTNSYGSYNGTSMATPHVSGALALCASMGSLRGSALRAALLSNTTATASLAGRTATGGRLDIGRMLTACGGAPAPATPTITSFTPTSGPVGSQVTITGTNLTGASAVTFGGASGTVGTVTSTSVTATVGAAAQTGPIAVTTPGGTATSGVPFTVTVNPPPTPTRPSITSVTATPLVAGATVSWTVNNGGSPVTASVVKAYEFKRGVRTLTKSVSVSGAQTTATVTGLKSRTNYSFTVTATNLVGPSTESAPSSTIKTK